MSVCPGCGRCRECGSPAPHRFYPQYPPPQWWSQPITTPWPPPTVTGPVWITGGSVVPNTGGVIC